MHCKAHHFTVSESAVCFFGGQCEKVMPDVLQFYHFDTTSIFCMRNSVLDVFDQPTNVYVLCSAVLGTAKGLNPKPGYLVMKWCLLFQKETGQNRIDDTDIEFSIGALHYNIRSWLFSA